MKLQFYPGTDMSAALSETVAYVNRARAMMPPGTPGPFVTRFDAGSVPVGYLVFATENEKRTVGQMQDAALNLVRPLFATLPGVSAPPPFGGSARTIVINVKPDRMHAYALTPDEIVTALSQANALSPSGNVNLGDRYPIVPTNAVVKNIKDLEGTPLRVGKNAAVFLRDVASIEDSSDLVTSYALVNGRRTVYMPVTKRADASTLAVVSLVRESLPKFQNVLPDDITVSYELDQSPVVWRSITNLVTEGALGALLTGLMVLVFLRDWRSALVVLINIPLAIAAATFALWITGQSINLMTLGGLALAVGILVDEATVTVENIHTHLARGASVTRAARDASIETITPRLLAMLCIVAVFLPALFMTGAAKALFTPLALAVGFSMLGSYLLSSTLVPILAVWLLGSQTPHQSVRFARFRDGYARWLSHALSSAGLIIGTYVIACVALVWILGTRLGTDIFPKANAGEMALRLHAPAGTRIEITETIAKRVLDIVKNEVGVDSVALTLGLVGVHAPNYPVNLIYLWNGGPEDGWLAFQFKAGAGVHIDALQERLRGLLANELPDVRFSFEPSDIVNRVMSFGSNTPIEVAVSGPNIAVSREYATKIFDKLQLNPALRDVQFAQALDFPSVDININRERAGVLGVKARDVVQSMVAATASSRFTVPNYWADPNSGVGYNLQVQIPQSKTTSLEDIKNIPVAAQNGEAVLLRNVASVTPGTAVGQYERYNMARVVSITANIHGEALSTAAKEVNEAIAEVGDPPAKTSVTVRGQIVPLNELLNGFKIGLLVAVIVIALLLTAYFESLRLATIVFAAVPAAIAGAVLSLATTGTTINVQSAMGAIMSIGIAVANAILFTTFAERSRVAGLGSAAAAIAGASSRLRPIIMTTSAMVAGMLPLALGTGAGGEQIAPLARAVVGGLALATVSTLIVLPAVFTLLSRNASTASSSLDPDEITH
jgi:multidrug efflux pump subunit AcrB